MMKREEERAVRMPKQRESGVITVMEQDVMETASCGSARRAMIRMRLWRLITAVTLTVMVMVCIVMIMVCVPL